MSKILTKTAKKTTLLSIVLAAIVAIAVAIGVICGVKGFGVFNKSALLKDSNMLTVTVNYSVYQTQLDEVQDACEDVFSDLKVSYSMKGEMTGEESEIVYVFDKETDLSAAKTALEAKFEEMKANEWKDVLVFVTVASASETVIASLAEYYVLGGIFAGIALAALVFAYVALRHSLNKGILAAACTVAGVVVTAALLIVTRIPVTASVMYVLAAAAILSAVTTVLTLNKIGANEKDAENQSAEELVEASVAAKEILTLCVLAGAALVVIGAVATNGVRWFAIQALVAVLVSTFIGLLYAPALYLPMKKAAEKKPVKDAYVGAKKTSTKAKKVFAKKETAPVAAAPAEAVEETVEEAPAEAVEETVEEAPVEAVEETVEETPVETVEETVEEAPVETVEAPAETETSEEE